MRRHRRIVLLVAALGMLVCAAASQARDYGQYDLAPQDIRNWVQGLADGHGIPCCATADGTVPDDFAWDMSANHYRVKVYGQWVDVPDDAVVKGPNRLGHAVVWVEYDEAGFTAEPTIGVRCFLPGPAS